MDIRSIATGFLLGFVFAFIAFILFYNQGDPLQTSVPPEPAATEASVTINLASIFVNDQDKALKFYTEMVGFVVKHNIPVGEFKWLTVVSPEGPGGMELLLEPDDHQATKTYQKAIYDDGIPATTFFVTDIQQTYERMKASGVVFTREPTKMGSVTTVVFDDTCGNLIQLTQTEQ